MHEEFNPQYKFPEMQPIRSAPSLWRINGCGVSVYGSRDFDQETYSFVTTTCICILFIPLIALRAYRVIADQHGWIFLGRVPLSAFAKCWNGFLALSVVGACGFVAYGIYANNPDRIARSTLARADRMAKEGHVAKAVDLYRDVALGTTSEVTNAKTGLQSLIAEGLEKASAQNAARALRVAVELKIGGIAKHGLRLAKKLAEANPTGSMAILEAFAPAAYGDDAKAMIRQRRQLLEKIVAANPNDINKLTELALAYEAEGNRQKCEQLLAKHKDSLGTGDGARILGQIYAGQGKTEEALALLTPLVEERLKKFTDAYQRLGASIRTAEGAIISQLKSGKAAGFDFDRYKRLGRAAQNQMVNDYIDKRLAQHQSIKTARQAVRKNSQVVAAALDVGMLLLRKGQAAANPDDRKKHLKEAEKTFLAIGGVAGKSDEYRLNLGKVYYWLGDHAKGQKLFDEMLKEKGRPAKLLLAVARSHRQLGEVTKARALCEEAYKNANGQQIKYAAAGQRALLETDLDERITWLERCDPNNSDIKATMHAARGNKASSEGDDAEAIVQYKLSIGIYEKMPDSAFVFNNNAINYLALHAVAADPDALDKGLSLVEKAVALSPSDSILLRNAAETLVEVALRDSLGAAVKLQRLRQRPSTRLLPYLFDDAEGKTKVYKRLQANAALKKARDYLERLLVLAPKSPNVYRSLTTVFVLMDDTQGLKDLQTRVQKIEFDLSDSDRETLKFYQGKNDDKIRRILSNELKRKAGALAAAKKIGGTTLAVAASSLASAQIGHALLNDNVDADNIVKLAEQGYDASPSAGTRSVLVAALLFRAGESLRSSAPEFHKMSVSVKRSLGSALLIAHALSIPGELPKKILLHSDVRRAVKLLKESAGKFPDDPGEWQWVILRAADSDLGKQLAEAYRIDQSRKLVLAIERKIDPVNASLAMESHWAGQITGETENASAYVRAVAGRGVPLPFPVE